MLMIITILVLLGLCLGSFINALVWRIHEQSLPRKKRVAVDSELSITKGRSMCPHCQHILAWYDLLPLISWVSLVGRCRYCHKPISTQYPLVELLTTLLFVASYIFWPTELVSQAESALFSIWIAALVGLVALLVYDLRWMILPNRIVFPVTGLAAFGVLLQAFVFEGGVSTIVGAIGGLLVAGGIFYVLFQISGGKWIGGGDVKLGFALGLLLGGPAEAFLMLFSASILGLIVALPGVIIKKTSIGSRIPFGPFLIIATIFVKLFGASIIMWYKQQFLYL